MTHPFSPLSPVLRGEGLGVRGLGFDGTCPPHPNPSPPSTGARGFRAPVLLAVVIGAGLVFLLTALLSQADEKKPEKPDTNAAPLTETRVIERVTASTDKALDWLESKQIKQGENTGAWNTNQAFNALAMLAFMSSGHTPGRGKYGDVIENGVVEPGVLTRGKKYMLSKAQPTGYISSGAMYEHGLAALCLAEMYGMDPDPDLEDKLRKAVELIVKTQSPAGGWRYTPAPTDQDLSVTVMQVVALRAAYNAGIRVPDETLGKAVKYVQSSAQRGPDNKPVGGFGYQGPGQSPQTSAGGTLCLQLLGHYDDPTIPPTLQFLSKVPVEWGGANPPYFYYFHYYAIQAFYQAGGKEWNEWHPRVRELLLKHQNADGSWDVPAGSSEAQYTNGDKVYSTAMATLILDIYRHYLPAYQR
jgi:hypothetical protein